MNPTPPEWQRLVASARRHSDRRDDRAPFGFATRVAALAFAAERPIMALFERLSLRAMGVACLLAVAAVAANYGSVRHFFDRQEMPIAASDDTLAEMVDLATS
jgi:hypothetical protein